MTELNSSQSAWPKTFKEAFCERFKCPPERYEQKVFLRCLYRHALPVASVSRAERLEHSGDINFDEVIEKQLAGRGAAIHNHEVHPLQRTENAVELALVCEIEELHVRVKPLQG